MTTPPQRDAIKQFVKIIQSHNRERSDYDKFRDFCEMAYCAFAKLTAPNQERADELEARYMQIVGQYRDKEFIREGMPEMLGIGWNAMMDGGMDFLGTVAGEIGALNERAGQFFTPFEVSRMMAQMQLSDVETFVEKQGYITIQEPAAGAGSMIVAAADAIRDAGCNPCIHMLVHAIDISPLAYHMCFLQLTWRGIPAYVERANALSMEHFEGAYTLPSLMFLDYHGHLFTKPKNPIEEAVKLLDLVVNADQSPESAVEPIAPEKPKQPYQVGKLPEPELPMKPEQLRLF